MLDALTDPARARAELGLTEEEADSLAAVLPHASFLILPMENVNGRKKVTRWLVRGHPCTARFACVLLKRTSRGGTLDGAPDPTRPRLTVLQVENNESCERKNGRGVDINRNYEVDWGVKEPDYNPSEEYPGTKPLSEPEAALTLSLGERRAPLLPRAAARAGRRQRCCRLSVAVREFKPHAFVNIHSGMFAMFAPYDHLAVVPDDENARAQLQLLEQINSKVCRGQPADAMTHSQLVR